MSRAWAPLKKKRPTHVTMAKIGVCSVPSMLLVLLLRAGLLPRVLMYVLSIQILKHSKNQDSFQKLMEELEKEGSQRQRYLGSTEAPASAQRSTDCGNQWKRVRCWILLLMTAWCSR